MSIFVPSGVGTGTVVWVTSGMGINSSVSTALWWIGWCLPPFAYCFYRSIC